MRAQIDTLVREIRHHLSRPLPTNDQLATLSITLGIDGYSLAAQLLAVLTSYIEDERLEIEHRRYAQQQLDALITS